MIDADDLVHGVLRGLLGGRRKESRRALGFLSGGRRGVMSNPNALLTVAGLAWGVYETLQQSGQTASPWQQAPAPGGVAVPPLPPQGAGAPLPPDAASSDALRIVRLAIAAANADGTISEQDRAAVMAQARAADAESIVEQELQRPKPLAEVVAGVTDPGRAATLYVLAFTVARGDESVSGAERIFLAQLAHHLNLSPETVAALESGTSNRIDEQSGQVP